MAESELQSMLLMRDLAGPPFADSRVLVLRGAQRMTQQEVYFVVCVGPDAIAVLAPRIAA